MSTYAVIMAGGSGTRFWPASRPGQPKQLLPLAPGDERSLLRATIERIAPLVPIERVLVVTSEALASATAAEIPELPTENLLAEPCGRNTAPCVAWAAAHVRRLDPAGRMIVLPADHHIGETERYLAVLRAGVEACAEGALVTVGIEPTRPETGYGYLELGDRLPDVLGAPLHQARRFVEKPNQQRAEQFLASGQYLWNSGMFFFRADAILDAVEKFLPGLHEAMLAFDQAAASDSEADVVRSLYPSLPSISIDHGIMEKAAAVFVVPGSFGWSDLGSWTTAWELATHDADGNAMPSDAIAIDAEGCLAHVPAGKQVAFIGVKDLIVVDTGDALLVVPRDMAQRVRDVAVALAARTSKETT